MQSVRQRIQAVVALLPISLFIPPSFLPFLDPPSRGADPPWPQGRQMVTCVHTASSPIADTWDTCGSCPVFSSPMENDNIDEHLTWIQHSEQVAREKNGMITRNDLNYNNRYSEIHIPAARPQGIGWGGGKGSEWSLEHPHITYPWLTPSRRAPSATLGIM